MSRVILEVKLNVKPFSANKMHYASAKRDTKEYREFKETVRSLLMGTCEVPEGSRLRFCLIGGTSSPLSDLDNFFKAAVDSLQLALGFNDRQIFEIQAFKTLTKKGNEYLMIRLEELTEEEYVKGIQTLFPSFFKEIL